MARGDKLTSKQRLFCIEYVRCKSGTEAAINAGYSKNCAQQIGSENLYKPLIKDKIEQLEKNTQQDLRDYFMEEAEESIQDLVIMRNKIRESVDNKESYSDKDNKLLNIRKDIDRELLYLAGYKPTDKIEVKETSESDEWFGQ